MMDEKVALLEIIAQRQIRTVFQPIVDVLNTKVVGYEALSRGPKGSPYERPDFLFEAALRHNMLWDLELVCRSLAIQRAHQLGLNRYLFLNVDPRVIRDEKFREGFTAEFMKTLNMDPCRIIFEITEKTAIEDYKSFRETLNHYIRQGYKIAIDDTGAGHSGMRLITETQPHFIKLDMGLVRDIDKDSFKQAVCRNLVVLSKITNMRLIAEGVETISELNMLIGLGVDYVQGYLLGKPIETLQDITEEMREHIGGMLQQRNTVLHTARTFPVGRIARMDDAIDTTATGMDVVATFHSKPTQGLVVVQSEVPVGLIMKNSCNAHLATPFGNALYLKRSAELLMDRNPLVVEYDMPIAEVSQLAMARREENLYDYIIVTKGGQYFGIVTVKRLLEHATELELNYARHLNPLTGLPGNLIIEQRLEQAIVNNEGLTVLYIDIDRFKAYNDTYGFENGDRVIQMTADILRNTLSTHFGSNAFLGHVGGDDFVAVTPYDSPKVCAFGQATLQSFEQLIAGLYNLEHWQQGYTEVATTTSEGESSISALMSLSIAGMIGSASTFKSVAELAEEAAKVKRICKQVMGSCFRLHEINSNH